MTPKPKISDTLQSLGKKVLYVHTFTPKNPPGMDFVGEPISFSAFYKAEDWLKKLGYITGSMEMSHPIGFGPASYWDYISKWTNMNSVERRQLHGVMLSDNFRSGEVHVVFCESPLKSLVKVVQFKNVTIKKKSV
jgi:hypothetical protein